MNFDAIKQEIKHLSLSEQGMLATLLLDELLGTPPSSQKSEEVWLTEAESRLNRWEQGATVALDGDAVESAIAEKYGFTL
jgi:hypothetical protein